MSGFFSKLFGGKGGKKGESVISEVVKDALEGVIERGGFKLYYELTEETEEKIVVELHGEDEALLREKDGQLLDSFQFLTKRVIQHRFPESRVDVIFDSNGYREESSLELVKIADKLKAIVIEKNKSVYFRALPPKDRKIVHQYLADDARVGSRSVGDGLYKKIKIFPAGGAPKAREHSTDEEGSHAPTMHTEDAQAGDSSEG
jgi:spoIIIJ-associated protein